MSRIEEKVIEKILERAKIGLKKYGVDMTRGDFGSVTWLQYLQEELLDAAIYLERLIEEMSKNDESIGRNEGRLGIDE